MNKENIKPGDFVKITDYPVKDAYNEVWHNIGDELEVIKVVGNNNGVMFASDLGTAMHNITLVRRGLPKLNVNNKTQLLLFLHSFLQHYGKRGNTLYSSEEVNGSIISDFIDNTYKSYKLTANE